MAEGSRDGLVLHFEVHDHAVSQRDESTAIETRAYIRAASRHSKSYPAASAAAIKPIHLSISPSLHLSISPSIHLSIYPSLHLLTPQTNPLLDHQNTTHHHPLHHATLQVRLRPPPHLLDPRLPPPHPASLLPHLQPQPMEHLAARPGNRQRPLHDPLQRVPRHRQARPHRRLQHPRRRLRLPARIRLPAEPQRLGDGARRPAAAQRLRAAGRAAGRRDVGQHRARHGQPGGHVEFPDGRGPRRPEDYRRGFVCVRAGGEF